MVRVLVVTAVTAERDAVVRDLGRPRPLALPGYHGRVRVEAEGITVDVVPGGVGPAAAATATAVALRPAGADGASPYDLVMSAGVAGGFVDVADVGSVAVATATVAADLGVDSPEGFVPLDGLDLGRTSDPVDRRLVAAALPALRAAGITAVAGPVLTVATVTGTADRAAELRAAHPGAVAEAMEGFGVATAARVHSVPFLEVRAVSNPVGSRDRGAWRLDLALDTLATTIPALAAALPATLPVTLPVTQSEPVVAPRGVDA